MSDNITREPYRNAWYKQLQEEVSKITPHLVPEVENDDNGKILVAGQEGTFDWAQPPEELPVITESDEGKVLKVDDGVPKWLTDSDTEYLLVTITKNDNVYTADKEYSIIREFAIKGKAIVIYDGLFYALARVADTFLLFARLFPNNAGSTTGTYDNYIYFGKGTDTFQQFNISENSIVYNNVRYQWSLPLTVTNGNKISTAEYAMLQRAINGVYSVAYYNNTVLALSKKNSGNTEFDFESSDGKVKAHIASNRTVTITTNNGIPTPTVADEGKVLMVDANGDYTLGTVQSGSPHYAEVSLGISVE